MTPRVVLHVGAMKTGSTYLQHLLSTNRAALREAGVLVAPHRSAAVHDVMDYEGAGPARLAAVRGSWDATAARMRDHDGRVSVLSHEYLSFVAPRVVRRVGASFEGAELHVVVTLRDAAGTLPAQWQTFARNRGTMTWPEYAVTARDGTGTPRTHTFLRSQRTERTLRLWGGVAGPGRLHVVTVPPAGAPADLLWERFALALGVDPAAAPDRSVAANTSVGYASAHLLCLLHQATTDLPRRRVRALALHLADVVLTARRSQEPRPGLDAETLLFTSRWNQQARDAVLGSGAHLVGSLDDLPILSSDDAAVRDAGPLTVPAAADVLAAAEDAAAALARLAEVEAPDPAAWVGTDAVGRAVDDLARLVRVALDHGADARV